MQRIQAAVRAGVGGSNPLTIFAVRAPSSGWSAEGGMEKEEARLHRVRVRIEGLHTGARGALRRR